MKKVCKNSRHIRWNWEKSPEIPDSVRYHFVVVNDKGRGRTLNLILEQLQKVESGLENVRIIEGNVVNSKFKYLFASYDSVVAPKMIDWTKLNKQVRKDADLFERSRGSIENYVADLYER